MKQMPDTATLKEFAAVAGFKPSYAHQLKADGRLVMDGSGKRVLVAESLDRIRETRDPAKQAVAARHAAQRLNAAAGAEDEDADPPQPGEDSNGYQSSRATKERYLALVAKRDYEISMGKLMDAAQVETAIAEATTVLRSRLESLADILGPMLAAIVDEAQCRATLAEAIEHALSETARQFERLAKAGAA